MSKVICIMGESGSGKTTSMRNLDPKTTLYIDCDKKGLSWKGWREQYNSENQNYIKTDFAQVVQQALQKVDKVEKWKHMGLWYPMKCAGVRKKDMTNGWIWLPVSGIW